MTRRRFLLAPLSSIVGLILACGEVAKAADFYVAPNGNIYMLRYVGREASPLTVMLNWRPATN